MVNVSSFRHSVGTADSAFLTGQRSPGGYDAAYNSTKLMNVLFTAELARRLQGTGGCWATPGSAVPCGTLGTPPVPTLCAPMPHLRGWGGLTRVRDSLGSPKGGRATKG